MRTIIALLLLICGFVIIFFGHKNVKVKEGKIIRAIDFLKKPIPPLEWLQFGSQILVQVVIGLALIFLAVMTFIGKL